MAAFVCLSLFFFPLSPSFLSHLPQFFSLSFSLSSLQIEKLLGVPKVDISLQFDDGKEVVKKEKEKENWREKTQEGRETVLVPYGGTPEDLFIYFGKEKRGRGRREEEIFLLTTITIITTITTITTISSFLGAEKVSGTVILSSDAPVPVNGVNIELIGCVGLLREGEEGKRGRRRGEEGKRGRGEEGKRGRGEEGKRGRGEEGKRGRGEEGKRGRGEDGRGHHDKGRVL